MEWRERQREKDFLREKVRRDYAYVFAPNRKSDFGVLAGLPITRRCPGCQGWIDLTEKNLQWALVVEGALPHIALMHPDCTQAAREYIHIAEIWIYIQERQEMAL